MILASESPRRADILRDMGISFIQVAPNQDELTSSPDGPAGLVRANALLKGKAVASQYPDQWVLAADTVVVIDGEVLGKPKDMQEAWQMLGRLSGRQHEVYTGYALYCESRVAESIAGVEVSKVTFHELDLATIQEYCRLVNPLDKAGAYGIQQEGQRIVAHLEGSLTNVIGLPSEALKPHLSRLGFTLNPSVV